MVVCILVSLSGVEGYRGSDGLDGYFSRTARVDFSALLNLNASHTAILSMDVDFVRVVFILKMKNWLFIAVLDLFQSKRINFTFSTI